ncbi:MAG: hypothetical protein DBY09_02275 [Selenomonadales bacterium]|nr:MAG: hypothetical protein DBY09_02275 [Selenomonadales bacterium]
MLVLSRIVFDLHLFYRAAPDRWSGAKSPYFAAFGRRFKRLPGPGAARPSGRRPQTTQNMETWPLGARRAPKGRLKNKH